MQEVSLGVNKFIPGPWSKPCDTCKSSSALLFCKGHSLFLCISCDTNIHAPHARHERVFLCDVCEHAPAIVTCKADAAALCAACDHDIHTANPLAHRHDRVPVVPFLDDVSAVHAALSSYNNVEQEAVGVKCEDFLFSDTDQFLQFACTGTGHADSVVPVQTYEEATAQHIMHQLSDKYLEIDFTNSKFNSISNSCIPGQSISQSISSSSMDVGVVPDGSSVSEISYPYIQTSTSTVDRTGISGTIASQGSDREARVMRYREKRKNRKFEKTIRYASRKAYAETRPRIKGRFAKRTETRPESVNRMFINNPSAFLSETAGYDLVPSI